MANITISSPVVSSNGDTITATLGAGSGDGYAPSSGITGVYVRNTRDSGSQFAIASTSISGAVLTITLSAFIPSGETIKLDVGTSNITDSGSNSVAPASDISVTNNSTKAATWYNGSNAAIQAYGRLAGTYNAQLQAPGTEIVFVATGTDAFCRFYITDTTPFYVSIDGAAATTPTVSSIETSPTNQPYQIIKLFSGLSDAAHTVVIKQRSDCYMPWNEGGAVAVSGASPSLSAPGSAHGYGPYSLTKDSHAYADQGSWIYSAYAYGGLPSLSSDRSFLDCTYRLNASASGNATIKFWTYRQGDSFALLVGGVVVSSITTANSGDWGFVTFPNQIDLTGGKVFSIAVTHSVNASYLDAVMVIGTSASFGSSIPSQGSIAGFGDSIVQASANPLSTEGTNFKLSARFKKTPFNRGIAGTLVASGSNNGVGRTSDITSISPEPERCWVAYGTNDLLTDNSSPSGGFGTAFQSMLNSLLSGTTNTIFIVEGIRPKQGFTLGTINAWNGSGNGIQGSIAAVIAGTPSYSARIKYVDPVNISLTGVSGTDYTTNFVDGEHLNDAGYTLETNYLAPFFYSLGKHDLGFGGLSGGVVVGAEGLL
jgi:lysophospholipase L1-like esterase